MLRRLLPALALLSLCAGASTRVLATPILAIEARIAFPSAYADDLFLKSLLSNKALAEAGLKLLPRQSATESEAMSAIKTGGADLGVFTLADEDLKKLRQAGDEASLLTRPFVFASAAEVSLMQNTFLGDAAAAGAGKSGLFPIKIWSHSITYFLTREPIRTAADFKKLTVAAEDGAPDVRILSAVGARTAPAGAGTAPAGSMGVGKTNALETQLGDATKDFAAKFDGKLYLTTGWPETGLLAAAPDFWLKLTEAQKAALKTAADEARQYADKDLMTREDAIRKVPNIIVNPLSSDTKMELAMHAGGGGHAELNSEMTLWHKAEVEVHGMPGKQAPLPEPKKMASVSPVLFATDRNDEGGTDYKTRFGARRLDPFEYSCAYLGAPARHSGEPKLPPAPKDLTKGLETCAKLIVDKTREAGLSKILFLIHGFNIPFDGLVWRSLQVGSDLDYNGAIVGWSWPSEGSAFSYAYDEDSNTWSEPHLVDLVAQIAEIAPDIQLDFVAHSMGNRMLLQMLRELAQARSKIRIGAAVFAAPDVAQDVFRAQIRIAQKIGGIRTLYASQYDRAILISESYHKAPRAGSGGDNIMVTDGIESVDTRLGGHSYVFDEPKAIQDFSKIVNRETAAPERGLPGRGKAGAVYWVIEP